MDIHIGHSPDPDDAFMWYPLDAHSGPQPAKIDTGPYRFVHVLQDIQSLNERSQRGDLEITALSFHQYPFVADRYALTSCGASMGDGYGPMVVARRSSGLTIDDLGRVKIAIPGRRTSAMAALSLFLGRPLVHYDVVPFDQITRSVASGRYDAGLIIHEGQLTYDREGLQLVVDLGQWWHRTRQLPLPLGGNAIRRDLGDRMPALCRILRASIDYALAHRQDAIGYAMQYARGLDTELADRFVGMYVNKWTLDLGPQGRGAVDRFLAEAAQMDLVPAIDPIDVIEPVP